ncbi:hypothetical protein RFI_09473 [Reticulomyxa filosa]|uniref:Uncharacterized protein n=1 Tax=Reticulomyxa filosa TaxID=46433 RepID=X6NPN3_RETFI|nr:hypothetical protein RFI_09473 [Reticulomyxa filosa]|eukprot:ETO27659.1 hypothetical protein RFI_09473 [Reticulomyxa filosa]
MESKGKDKGSSKHDIDVDRDEKDNYFGWANVFEPYELTMDQYQRQQLNETQIHKPLHELNAYSTRIANYKASLHCKEINIPDESTFITWIQKLYKQSFVYYHYYFFFF